MIERELTKFEEDVARKAIKEVISKGYITKDQAKKIIEEQHADLVKIYEGSIDKSVKFGLFVGVIATSAIWLVMMWLFN